VLNLNDVLTVDWCDIGVIRSLILVDNDLKITSVTAVTKVGS